jgi:uncharacterized protein YjhX (UPF0386 family)
MGRQEIILDLIQSGVISINPKVAQQILDIESIQLPETKESDVDFEVGQLVKSKENLTTIYRILVIDRSNSRATLVVENTTSQGILFPNVPLSLLEPLVKQKTVPLEYGSLCSHEFVNIGFYTMTMACKHCGCDQQSHKSNRILLNDLRSGQKLKYIYDADLTWVSKGTIVTVGNWEGDWLHIDVPGSSQFLSFHKYEDKDVTEYFEVIE